ncbi:GT4 family glycosyltransferase PelF [uncultured Pseudodesulfovibrio sp.]|uniref:GT4 family glycosyltransferase PelF n=1 Tax=uncultured Pseudodesulfovibrio sp. TaxID=2035858 RepID=UPI0029C7E939|nr:GT4 family glycosyltransferase PelF [uncultured Pseudodesulfovibrio sp.]
MSKHIRVVFVLQDLDFGGAQRQALELASRLDRTRFQLEMWVLCSGGGFVPRAETLDIPLTFLSSARKVGPAALWGLWRCLRRARPDIVVPSTVVPNIWCRILGRFASLPLIVGTCRGGGAIRRQKERFLWTLVHHHICNADTLRQTLVKNLRVPEERVSVIGNGIVLSGGSSGQAGQGQNILSVGRLVPDKDHGTLIRAFAAVVNVFPDVSLTIIGDGPLLAEHRNLVRSLGLEDSVVFLPGQPSLEAAYAGCDVFALSSETEALPNVVMEAAAAGKPVVATTVGDVPKLVNHGVSGLLVESRAPEKMADALIELLKDPAIRQEMGKAGQERMEELFGMEKMVRRYEDLFFDLHTRHGGG